MSALDKIISSKARSAIFQILFGFIQKELHLREIQRRSGLSIETIRKEITNLEEIELVSKRKDGNRNYFSANKSHPVYKEIHQLVLKTSSFIDIIKDSLNENDIKFAFIYGSIAKGEEKAWSDLDLFVIGKIRFRELSNKLIDPAERIGREINPHAMELDEFKQKLKNKDHFISEVSRSPKIMLIGSEDELAGLV